MILQLTPMSDIYRLMYDAFPDVRFAGVYLITSPLLVIKDPELIKQITVKDFEYFLDHSRYLPDESEPLWGKNLFALKGERWKEMRATLSPAFTSSKMKTMFFQVLSNCSERFVNHFKVEGSTDTVKVELKDAFTRFTNDAIASSSFGVECDSLKEPENEFYQIGKEATTYSGFWKNLKVIIISFLPKLALFFGIRLFTDNVSAFFRNLVVTNIAMREKDGIVRPDMIHLLMEARKGRLKHERSNDVIDSGYAVIAESKIGKEEHRQKLNLSDDDVTAQAMIFFNAGFDTVAAFMCFTAYELAVNPYIQERLREEVDNVLREGNGTLTYEGLMQMEYMDMVLTEVLRKWPPSTSIDRKCVKPYTIPPKREGEKPVHLKKGDMVIMVMYGMQLDEKYYPDPDRFDPERFSKENRINIVPYTYVPFGVGPRSCIGNRFALLETKVLFFYILRYFEIVVVKESVVPIKISRKIMKLNPEKGFWFGLKPRTVHY
ncbi:cytochrome P450 9e2-like [Photinus pyralis]|uniref:cytochrome P450 9e2-like n=1 Tax=Photinus pyralis TaxID=7054 RepID=UPI00126756B1|nr:cytochrome P450 9e2-like [Photinus pyralis]